MNENTTSNSVVKLSDGLKTIVLGGGCFWCIEGIFQLVKGIEKVVSGYSGGEVANPTYEAVCTGKTGHAEVVEITYNSKVISLTEILDIFFHLHDPTTLNRQGNDVGTQYRSAIYYLNNEDLPIIEKVLEVSQDDWKDKIVTEVSKLSIFYPAEKYHQNFFKNNPEQGYCQLVINPKIAKLRQKYFSKLI
jgi:methionine-S-sulfoxide reductase